MASWFGTSSSKDKNNSSNSQSLRDPTALTSYYMDTMLCNDFYLSYQECEGEYNSKAKWRFWGRRKLLRECMNRLDEYKACVVGINQDKFLYQYGKEKKVVSSQEMHQKYQNLKEEKKKGNHRVSSGNEQSREKESNEEEELVKI